MSYPHPRERGIIFRPTSWKTIKQKGAEAPLFFDKGFWVAYKGSSRL